MLDSELVVRLLRRVTNLAIVENVAGARAVWAEQSYLSSFKVCGQFSAALGAGVESHIIS